VAPASHLDRGRRPIARAPVNRRQRMRDVPQRGKGERDLSTGLERLQDARFLPPSPIHPPAWIGQPVTTQPRRPPVRVDGQGTLPRWRHSVGNRGDCESSGHLRVGSSVHDHREGNHEVRRTPRRRAPAAPVEAVTADPKPYVPSPEFAAAYAAPHNEIGPLISRWEGNRAVWLLP
jgi:hypothetical protein